MFLVLHFLAYCPTFTVFTITRTILLVLLQTHLLGFASESYMVYASKVEIFMQCVMYSQFNFTACNNLTDTQPQQSIVCIAPLLPWGHKWNLFCIQFRAAPSAYLHTYIIHQGTLPYQFIYTQDVVLHVLSLDRNQTDIVVEECRTGSMRIQWQG